MFIIRGEKKEAPRLASLLQVLPIGHCFPFLSSCLGQTTSPDSLVALDKRRQCLTLAPLLLLSLCVPICRLFKSLPTNKFELIIESWPKHKDWPIVETNVSSSEEENTEKQVEL